MPNDDKDNAAGVVVSFRDMYAELARLTGELRDVNAALKTGGLTDTDHETRIRALERWRYALPASVVLSAGSIIVTALTIWGHH